MFKGVTLKAMPIELLEAGVSWKDVDLPFLQKMFGVNFSWLHEQENSVHPNGRVLLVLECKPDQMVHPLDLTPSEIFEAIKILSIPKLEWTTAYRVGFERDLAIVKIR